MTKTIIRSMILAAAVLATAGLFAESELPGQASATCKVTLGKNGGTDGDDCVTVTFGKPMPTLRTTPKRTFWTFDGYWDTVKTDENGNPIGKQYYDANMKSVRNWDKKGPATLWAKWTSNFSLGKIMSDWTSIAWFAMLFLAVILVAGVCVWGGGGYSHADGISMHNKLPSVGNIRRDQQQVTKHGFCLFHPCSAATCYTRVQESRQCVS